MGRVNVQTEPSGVDLCFSSSLFFYSLNNSHTDYCCFLPLLCDDVFGEQCTFSGYRKHDADLHGHITLTGVSVPTFTSL